MSTQSKVTGKVLIVDDEPNILLSLDFLMRKEGYKVFIGRNGTEASELADKNRPDVVILDIMMPDVDGYEVCRRIKTSEHTRAARVIFLSAKTKESDIARGYEAGADLYLTKPFSTRHLAAEVKRLMATENRQKDITQ